MRHPIIYLAACLFLFSCNSPTDESALADSDSNHFVVKYYGALKNIMHKGDISARFNLSELKNTKHLYALGALENLKGEIQIFDSEAFTTLVSDSTITFDKSYDRKAALLVYASVEKWNTFDIPGEVVSYEQLEKYIATIAQENRININEPFPFLIKGAAKSFDWHVINWKDGDTEHSHEKHIKSGPHGTVENREVELLGFYSDSHRTIFTHHTTNMHIHVKTKDNEIAGHIDRLTLGKGMKIKLPAGK